MSRSVDLAGLLADPAQVSDVPVDALPALLAALAAEHARLAAAQSALAARLAVAGRTAAPMPPPSEARPLTQEEAAELYRIPLRSLRRLTRTARVPSYQQGRNRMIRPADLEEYIGRCRAQRVKVGTKLDAY